MVSFPSASAVTFCFGISLVPTTRPRSIGAVTLPVISFPLMIQLAWSLTLKVTFISFPLILSNTFAGIFVVFNRFTRILLPVFALFTASITFAKLSSCTVTSATACSSCFGVVLFAEVLWFALFPEDCAFPLLSAVSVFLSSCFSSGAGSVFVSAVKTIVPPSFAAGMVTETFRSAETV